VLTPHPGEMARLTGTSTGVIQRDREGIARQFAIEYGCVLVLKGSATVIANESGDVSINSTGNSGLASGGTGDVLTGLLSGLLAQKIDVYDAARIAVFAHGLAADIAAKALTERGMIAPDVVDYLPRAWRAIESGAMP
jgi:NAD(P)H-hydrate epimerase